jgi:hypothetical protein
MSWRRIADEKEGCVGRAVRRRTWNNWRYGGALQGSLPDANACIRESAGAAELRATLEAAGSRRRSERQLH